VIGKKSFVYGGEKLSFAGHDGSAEIQFQVAPSKSHNNFVTGSGPRPCFSVIKPSILNRLAGLQNFGPNGKKQEETKQKCR